ncbi:M48 family metallopeptidase [uncultured Thiohalocapsa sp.]|uniref:M48 family metallopeptidase n=1 Tax=uncultured Thiohalocapsa sp. TaxID=768990 RepID=UPI0025F4CB53|nr:M48 family metallopeptidase [uncultured Thiohalocapsa sp.]
MRPCQRQFRLQAQPPTLPPTQRKTQRKTRPRTLLWCFSAALLATVVAVGCATAPETGRSQLILMSPAQEAEMGLKAFTQLKREKPSIKSGKNADMIRRVGRRIAKVAPVEYADWEFVLFEDDTPNAFALPGGKVGVNSGILEITKTEAGLATVLAHEVGHVVARHGAERASQTLGLQALGVIADVALAQNAPGARQGVMQAYGIGAQVGVLLPYSRVHELEADELGLVYMARAGYDPREAIAFWERFQAYNRKQGGGKPPEFLSTHPLDDRRIAELRALLPRAQAEYARASNA